MNTRLFSVENNCSLQNVYKHSLDIVKKNFSLLHRFLKPLNKLSNDSIKGVLNGLFDVQSNIKSISSFTSDLHKGHFFSLTRILL